MGGKRGDCRVAQEPSAAPTLAIHIVICGRGKESDTGSGIAKKGSIVTVLVGARHREFLPSAFHPFVGHLCGLSFGRAFLVGRSGVVRAHVEKPILFGGVGHSLYWG